MVLLRQSFSQGMVDEYDEVREVLESLHGMDRAVALVKQRIEQQGTLPGCLMQVLSQGVDEGLARYKEAMSGMALVSALFLVVMIEQMCDLPDTIAARLEDNTWDGLSIAYYLLLELAFLNFVICICFYAHMTHYFTYMFHRDADLIIWLLEADLESGFSYYSALPMTAGILLMMLALGIPVALSIPWYLAIPPYALGFVFGVYLCFAHKRYGTFAMERFIARQTKADVSLQQDIFLLMMESRAAKWSELKTKLDTLPRVGSNLTSTRPPSTEGPTLEMQAQPKI